MIHSDGIEEGHDLTHEEKENFKREKVCDCTAT